MDTSNPTSYLVVEAIGERGQRVRRAIADRYRADLQAAGYGDGHHGFAVSCGASVDVDKLKVVCVGHQIELPRSHQGPRGHRGMTFERVGQVLHLDHPLAGVRLTGWAFDRRAPNERRRLRLRTGSSIVAEQRATLFRSETAEAGGDGFHGFSLPLPARLDDLVVEDVATGWQFRIS